MRRFVVLSAIMCAAVAASASPASGRGEPKGCPADASVWTEVAYVTDPASPWQDTSLYSFLFDQTGIGEALIADFGLAGEQDAYFTFVGFVDPIDVNGDQELCAFWLGGNPGVRDRAANVVDNTSNAKH